MRCEVPLGQVCDEIVDCAHKTAPKTAAPYAYAVGTKAVLDGRILFSHARPVDEATYTDWTQRARPEPGDLILCREAPVGPVAMVPRAPLVCLGQRTVLLRPDRRIANSRFLLYTLLAPGTLAALHMLSEGSTVAHLNVGAIRAFRVTMPPLHEQERIAAVLGTLDDKIDSNRRLAALLEQAAAELFRARFVDFVGVEEFEESEVGRIPRGWQIGTLGDLAAATKMTVRPFASPEASFEHYSIGAFDEGRAPRLENGGSMLSAKTLLPTGDHVLLSKLNPATKRVWWPRPSGVGLAVCSPEFLVLEPRSGVPNSYLYSVGASDDRSTASSSVTPRGPPVVGSASSCPRRCHVGL